MIDYTNFERIFGQLSPFPYNRTVIQEAESYRRSFEGALFIDKILAALGLSKGRAHAIPIALRSRVLMKCSSQSIPAEIRSDSPPAPRANHCLGEHRDTPQAFHSLLPSPRHR